MHVDWKRQFAFSWQEKGKIKMDFTYQQPLQWKVQNLGSYRTNLPVPGALKYFTSSLNLHVPYSPVSYHSHPSVFCKHLLEKSCFPETFWNQKAQILKRKETSLFPRGMCVMLALASGLQDDPTSTASFRSQQGFLLWSFFLIANFHHQPSLSHPADPFHSERNICH